MSDEENGQNEAGLTSGLEPGMEPGDDFDDFDTGAKSGSLGEIIRTNPAAKAGVVAGIIILVVGGIILFGGKKEVPLTSRVNRGNSLKEAPGTSQVPENYRQAVQEVDTQAVENAIKTGSSAMPTPIAPPVGRVELPDDNAPEEDPLDRWRRIQEERQKRVEEAPELPKADPNAETIQALAQAMSQQMSSLIAARTPAEPRQADISPKNFLETEADREAEDAAKRQEAAAGDSGADITQLDIIVPAGTVEYAQLLVEANSDVPGPIMAQLASGPLAGAKILGSFSNAEEYLTLNFDTIIMDGISYSISAIAMNPDTANIGMLTDINHRYMQRIVLPAAAAFIEGLGSAIAQTDSTTVDTGTGTSVSQQSDLNTHEEFMKGVSKGASKISEILDDQADVEPQLKVRSGTPMGILFLQPVTRDQTSSN
jgi:intracellular multiplication protein IcmE